MASNEQKPVSSELDTTGAKSPCPSPSPSLELQKGKGKEKEETASQLESPAEENQENPRGISNPDPATPIAALDAQPWQAIFAPQYNAYYFYNSQTGETTWTNPLQPSELITPNAPSSDPNTLYDFTPPDSESSSSTFQYTALQAAALAQGIDPSLAHLDPSLLTTTAPASCGPIPSFQAKFNARTGAFTRPDARTPGHLSEYERMKRMSEFYFDVKAWEDQLMEQKTQEEEGSGKKRKRPTKKDLVMIFLWLAYSHVHGKCRSVSKSRDDRRRSQRRRGCVPSEFNLFGHIDLN